MTDGFINENLIKNKYIMKKVFLLITILSLSITNNFAQEDKFGAEPNKCKQNLSLYKEFVKQKNYDDALNGWRVVFDICPKSTKSIYIDGAKIYKYLAKKEKDEAKKSIYVDTLMLIYERRIEYFNQEKSVRGRQGLDLYKYRRADYEKAYGYMKISVDGEKAHAAVLQAYMQATVKMYKNKKIDPGDVVTNFSLCSSQIVNLINKEKDTTKVVKLKKVQSNIETLFIKSGAADCNVLSDYYTPKFEADPTNAELLKTITKFLGMNKCTDLDLFMKASEALYPIEPSAEAAYNIALLSLKSSKYSKAIEYYKKAISKSEDNEQKAKYNYELAKVYYVQKQYANARASAIKASSLKSAWGDPTILIAKIYASSASSCGTDKFEKNAVYWLAVDKLKKAKSIDPSVSAEVNKMIANYKLHFPGKEDAFFKGINEGDTYTVGCWINEKTKARF